MYPRNSPRKDVISASCIGTRISDIESCSRKKKNDVCKKIVYVTKQGISHKYCFFLKNMHNVMISDLVIVRAINTRGKLFKCLRGDSRVLICVTPLITEIS